jgi:adenylate cyclase
MLADAFTQAGRLGDAREALDRAMQTAEANDDRFHEAELHRLDGVLRQAESPGRPDAAEACFLRAVETARAQGSRGWELRAALGLARHRRERGLPEEARAALLPVYEAFTEGFTTPDLAEARILLETLD